MKAKLSDIRKREERLERAREHALSVKDGFRADKRRCCVVEGCGWCEHNSQYGVYVGEGYYCKVHALEWVMRGEKWVRIVDKSLDKQIDGSKMEVHGELPEG